MQLNVTVDQLKLDKRTCPLYSGYYLARHLVRFCWLMDTDDIEWQVLGYMGNKLHFIYSVF
jgi:hypothetical protein